MSALVSPPVIDTIPAAIPRDRYGRPKVIPANGGRPVPYTRCTTFVSVLEDTWNLSKWSQRNVAVGLSLRPDLLLAVSAHRENKAELNTLCEQASEAAAAKAGATTGTALHALTETIDRGGDVGPVPDGTDADLTAYVEATKNMTPTQIEAFCVLDWLKIGGTPDRVIKWMGPTGLLTKGKTYISDLKTGSSMDFGVAKMAMQLAVYSRSSLYDLETGERTPHGAEIDKGIIVHLPAGTGTCTVYVIDLIEGWRGVQLSNAVREWRSRDKRDAFLTDVAADQVDPLLGAIAKCVRPESIVALWRLHQADWTPAHTQAAAARKANLATPNQGPVEVLDEHNQEQMSDD